jgi:hypothetical protein
VGNPCDKAIEDVAHSKAAATGRVMTIDLMDTEILPEFLLAN